MSERRAGLEKVNARVEPAKDGRRPPLTLEASNASTGSGRRGSDVDMRAKEKRINMGSPTWREVSSQPAIREDQAGPRRVAERSAVALKRVMLVERRDLAFKGQARRSKSASDWREPSSLDKAFSRSGRLEMPKRTSACPAGALGGRPHQPPCPEAECGQAARSV